MHSMYMLYLCVQIVVCMSGLKRVQIIVKWLCHCLEEAPDSSMSLSQRDRDRYRGTHTNIYSSPY